MRQGVGLLCWVVGVTAWGGRAEALPFDIPRIPLREVGFVSGYGQGSLHGDQEEYQIVPVGLRLGFDLEAWLPEIEVPGRADLALEPFVNPVTGPDSNIEVGCGLLLKYVAPSRRRVSPYFEGGSGFIYTSQEVEEQSTQWNFLVQGGIGLRWAMTQRTSWEIGYRFRHLSNASLREPNRGVDVHCALFCLSFKY